METIPGFATLAAMPWYPGKSFGVLLPKGRPQFAAVASLPVFNPFRGLRILFEDHYKEQLRLVDVLLDRLRMLGGAGCVLAGLLLQGTQFSCALRGRVLPIRLLHGLLEAHEAVLAAARSGSNGHECADTATSRDFAAGQVVLVNNMQLQSISDQLIARSDRRRVLVAPQDGPDTHGEVSRSPHSSCG